MDNSTTGSSIRRRQHWPEQVRAEMEWGARQGLTPRQVEIRMNGRLSSGVYSREVRKVPDAKTIERYMRDWRQVTGDPWNLREASDEEAALVLPVLGEVAAESHAPFSLTKAEASWVARIRRMRPDFVTEDEDGMSRANALLFLAIDYAERERTGGSTEDLDALLIWAPWQLGNERQKMKARVFDALIDSGDLPRPRHYVTSKTLADWGLRASGEDIERPQEAEETSTEMSREEEGK